MVTSVNNLITNWLATLDILHWTAKGRNDFSGFHLIMFQYLHIFLCGMDIFSHFSFCPTLTLLLKTSLWFWCFYSGRHYTFTNFFVTMSSNISFRIYTSITTWYKYSMLNAMFHTIWQYSKIMMHVQIIKVLRKEVHWSEAVWAFIFRFLSASSSLLTSDFKYIEFMIIWRP